MTQPVRRIRGGVKRLRALRVERAVASGGYLTGRCVRVGEVPETVAGLKAAVGLTGAPCVTGHHFGATGRPLKRPAALTGGGPLHEANGPDPAVGRPGDVHSPVLTAATVALRHSPWRRSMASAQARVSITARSACPMVPVPEDG